LASSGHEFSNNGRAVFRVDDVISSNSDRDDLPTDLSSDLSTNLTATAGPAGDAVLALADCTHRLQALQRTCDQLQQALDNERDISLAIGITMAQQRLSRADAFSQLRNLARRRRCKLAEVAAELVQTAQSRAQAKT